MAKQLLGKEVTAAMNEKLQQRVAALKEKGVTPKLAIVRCGENPSDLSYEKGATSRAELIGVDVVKFLLPEDVTKEALIEQIEAINADDSIHGCLLFRPLPKHLKADQDEICNHLAACKDIDSMTDLSNAGVFMGKKLGFAPCTPQACMEILDYYGIDCTGKKAVVIGRSLVVGKPAAMMLLGKNATVTMCHTMILAVENILSYFPIPAEFMPNTELFMLTVKGESMINAGIYDGDNIIVSRQNTAHNGEMVVALVDDSATVKRFYKEEGHIRLQPENDYMDPIIVDNCEIIGKVIGVIRIDNSGL